MQNPLITLIIVLSVIIACQTHLLAGAQRFCPMPKRTKPCFCEQPSPEQLNEQMRHLKGTVVDVSCFSAHNWGQVRRALRSFRWTPRTVDGYYVNTLTIRGVNDFGAKLHNLFRGMRILELRIEESAL